jgi:hypothetical protein
MRQGKQLGLSANEKNDVWHRSKAGASLHEIGRVFDKPHSSMRCLLPRGGIPPAARRRSLLSLTLAEREGISRGIACGPSFREIARHLNRARSTVSREVSRHGGLPVYRAHEARAQASIPPGSSFTVIGSRHYMVDPAWVSSVARLAWTAGKGRSRNEEEWRVNTARVITRTANDTVIINHDTIRAVLADTRHAS